MILLFLYQEIERYSMADLQILKQKSILDVAQSLGIEVYRDTSTTYKSKEHDSLTFFIKTNTFKWFSRDEGGDVIDLVQIVKEASFREAIHYLETGEFPRVFLKEGVKQPFRYILEPYEEPFVEAVHYLQEERGLSDETIRDFRQAGVLAQAKKKAPDGYLESVLVFKSLDKTGRIVGATLQGILPNKERYEKKGYLKQILHNSDGLSGMSFDVGVPKRLVFAESPIDLMSYYESNRERLSDVRLVSMDGLKEATISCYMMELLADLKGYSDYQTDPKTVSKGLEALAQTTTFFQREDNQNFITLAVDNDAAGREFIAKLGEKGIVVKSDLPPLGTGRSKMDWNDYLKEQKYQKSKNALSPMTQKLAIDPSLDEVIASATMEQQEHQYRHIPEKEQYYANQIDREKFTFLLSHHQDFSIYNQYATRSDYENEMMTVGYLYLRHEGDLTKMAEESFERDLLDKKSEFFQRYYQDILRPEMDHSPAL